MNAAAIAKMAGVTEGDVLSMARSVAVSMKEGGITPEHLESEIGTELTLAYAESVAKNTQRMMERYLSDNDSRDTLQKTVLLQLTN